MATLQNNRFFAVAEMSSMCEEVEEEEEDTPDETKDEAILNEEKKENYAKAESGEKKGKFDHPVYHELTKINGEINRLRFEQLKWRLRSLKLSTYGSKDVLKHRLKSHYRKTKLIEANLLDPSKASKTHYDYYVVIDFEATCDEDNRDTYRHEIIEFPAVLVCTKNQTAIKEFHSYVRPVINPKLTEFCTSLTGITQDKVNHAPLFPEVLQNFEKWLEEENLAQRPNKFVVVTDGPWDMGRFLLLQCNISKLPFPSWAKIWINIRKTYSNFYDTRRMCLRDMLDNLGMRFQGQPHCGLHDSRNIARIAIKLLRDGGNMRANERIRLRKDGKYSPRERTVINIPLSVFVKMKEKEFREHSKKKEREEENSCDDGEIAADASDVDSHNTSGTSQDVAEASNGVDTNNLEDFPELVSKSFKF